MRRRLYKSDMDKKLMGVCGGIADYFNIDSTIVRLIFVFLTLCGGFPGVAAYLIAALVIPEDPGDVY
ncbi:MAG: PspC domain-containing protein [Lachnospiraceae bacterium]|nr:PspC domain-containing protein [Lachnospiraceae bacterium]